MNNEFDKKDTSNKYAWNDAMILDKIQEILEDKNIDDLTFTEDELEYIRTQLSENISLEDINQSAYIVAENVEELRISPEDDIKGYIIKLKNYLNNSSLNCIKAEFNGIEFDIYKDSSVDDLFNDYYSRYDEAYGISEMLSDLGLK